MDINKLKEQIEVLEKTLEEKQKQLLEAESNEPFVPQDEETYYFIENKGDVRATWYSEYCDADRARIEIHNCFKTKEKAEEVAKKVKEVLENAWSSKKEELAVYDDFGFKGILGEKTHITYENGTRAYVGDVILVTSKSNPNVENVLYVFKTNDYDNGAIMGYACGTSTKEDLDEFRESYTIEKIIDWSELVEGYIYPLDRARVKKFEGENYNE